VLSGRLARGDDEIVLGRVAARRLKVDVGDDLAISGANGEVTFHVTGLAVIPSIEGGDGVGEGGLVTLEGLRRLEPDAALGSATVRLRPGADDAFQRLFAVFGGGIGLPSAPPVVINIDRVRSTPFIVAGAVGALAVLSLAHQLITSARRRRRDLAVFRALGADGRWVGHVVHWQATVLVALVVVLAIPLGIAAGRVVFSAYIDRIGARDDLSIPVAMLALAAALLLVLGNLAAIVPARRARRDRPAAVLSGE
jgi:ABC-type lipoprotein release transport system permease subunit